MSNRFRSALVVLAMAAPASTIAASRVATDLSGLWTFKVITENGTGTPAVTMKQRGDSLTGTY
ncbi:MAG: hypothetical protein ACK5AK_09545, partial [Gemmatimonas sp.]